MVKLYSIIKIDEKHINTAQEKLRKYNLKGWKLIGCTSYYLIVEKDVECDSIVCLEGYDSVVKKKNMPLIYVVKKNGLYGIIDEYGIEIVPCTYIDCKYTDTLKYPEHCNDIIFYTENESYNYDRTTSILESISEESFIKKLKNIKIQETQ